MLSRHAQIRLQQRGIPPDATAFVDQCRPAPANPSPPPASGAPPHRWYALRHPVITFIGYAIAITWAVFWGMVIGVTIEEELEKQARPELPWYQLPNQEHELPPDVFPGLS